MHQRYLYLYSGAIGEALLGIHVARTLAANVPGATVDIVSPRQNPFVKELASDLPFVTYRDMPKHQLRGWTTLFVLMRHRYTTVTLETVTVPLPIWWQIILWCARFRGGIHVRYQMQGHERALPKGTIRLSYNCQTDNYFDTPRKVLELWGIEVAQVPVPTLPSRTRTAPRPYILFHFFAGNYRRTIPIDHARALLEEARLNFPDHAIVMTCMASERERAERMSEGMTVTLLSDGSASEVIELLSGADLVVGTASGILLVAAHLRKPTVALSCLSDPCWLPTFNPEAIIIAARDECQCGPNKTGECNVSTAEGKIFRCLFYIPTAAVVAAMHKKLG